MPWRAMDSLAAALEDLSESRLVQLVLYLVSSGALLTTGGAVRSGDSLPVPPEYFGASFKEVMETLRMRLPHPEWGNTNSSEETPAEETPRGDHGVVEASQGTVQNSVEVLQESPREEPSPDGGRFSLLEID